ncbi:hypothetical protein D3C79_842360 [compost metagenome]
MAAFHPVLGAEVFEVQPQRRLRPGAHGLDIVRRQLAGEGADHHICGLNRHPFGRPLAHIDALLPLLQRCGIGPGAHRHEGIQVVHPQAHCDFVLVHQLPRQAPGHADIAIIVDDGAKDVPGGLHVPSPSWCGKPRILRINCRRQKHLRVKFASSVRQCTPPHPARRPPCPATAN